MSLSTIIILVVLAALVFWAVAIYNRLVTLRNRFQNAFAQIEVQLKRRHDLIPNLVEVAKGYLSHERETLEAVIEARNTAARALDDAAQSGGADSGAMARLQGGEAALGSALGRFNVVVEQYPELKADRTMSELSEEMTTTENRIAFARQAFNDAVMNYNTYRQSFPQVALAGTFGHGSDASLLEFDDAEQLREVPKVSF
ncbi:MAG: LemA family protein [Gammaproteobacteria bacterium]|nr:LemA family protein [Gammaproteobacteria bacterium]